VGLRPTVVSSFVGSAATISEFSKVSPHGTDGELNLSCASFVSLSFLSYCRSRTASNGG